MHALLAVACSVGCAGISAAQQPDRLTVLVTRGNDLLDKHQNKDAISCYDQVLAVQPRNPRVLVKRAQAYSGIDEQEKALRDVQAALTLAPNMSMAFLVRGHIYRESGKSKLAIADILKAISLDPSLKKKWYVFQDLAFLYDLSGENQKAIEYCTKTIEIAPDYLWAYSFRGTMYKKLGQYHKAIADFTQATKLHSDMESVKLFRLRADCYDKIGKHDLAAKDRAYADKHVQENWADVMSPLK